MENKKLNDSEILYKLMEELKLSGLKLSKALGYKSHQSIHQILKQPDKYSISENMADKIIKEFPEVNYWFLKKGNLPVLLSDKLARNQSNILFSESTSKQSLDYSLESFAVLKSIEATLLRIEDLLNKKSDQ